VGGQGNGPDPEGDWAGLGLDYGTVRLTEARVEWGLVAQRLARRIGAAIDESASQIEHIGSTAVPGLACKPIVDLAVGVRHPRAESLRAPLEGLGYIYRGDAGERGGLVFVLETRPRHRVAHVHVVRYGGEQWTRYLAFRDLLLADPTARDAYARLKHDLARAFPDNRVAYTDGKEQLVSALLEEAA
jgi:GrpB-like predicted nucleotidyltransferase (UPF0157 family)